MLLAKVVLRGWLKLKENVVPAATDTGPAAAAAAFTFPLVLTHVTPHVMSKLSDGVVSEAPTMRTTTLTLLGSGLATMAVQVCMLPLLLRLRWWVQWIFPLAKDGAGRTLNGSHALVTLLLLASPL